MDSALGLTKLLELHGKEAAFIVLLYLAYEFFTKSAMPFFLERSNKKLRLVEYLIKHENSFNSGLVQMAKDYYEEVAFYKITGFYCKDVHFRKYLTSLSKKYSFQELNQFRVIVKKYENGNVKTYSKKVLIGTPMLVFSFISAASLLSSRPSLVFLCLAFIISLNFLSFITSGYKVYLHLEKNGHLITPNTISKTN